MEYPNSNLVSKCYTPKIMWYQTDVTVIIRILLPDVDKYFLRVECDHLLFSTVLTSKNYYVCLYLFGTVIAEKTTHVNLGREIKITLVKAHKWTEWLRLCVERIKNPMISVDADHVYNRNWIMDSIKNIEKESFAEKKLKYDLINIMPDAPSSDEEASDDEEMDKIFLL